MNKVWRRRRLTVLVVFGLCIMMMLTISNLGECSPTSKPKSGGTLTVGVEVEFRGYDPLKANFMALGDRSVAMAVEERLFDMDAKGNLVPELALSAKQAKDGKSWTIALRKGVSFHDGTPFNADAVVGHWQRLLDPKNKFFGASTFEPIEAVKKVDDYTVRFDLKHPWTPFKEALSSPQSFAAYIASPKALQGDIH